MKKRLSQMAVDLPITFEEGREIIGDGKLPEGSYKAFGKDYWLDEKAQAALVEIADPKIGPRMHKAKILRKAPNPRFVYGLLTGKTAVVPIQTARKWAKSIVGKTVDVEEIEDDRGASYRYIRSS